MSKPRDHDKHTSKLLSRALRHDPEVLGLTLDAQGYVSVEDLLYGLACKGRSLSKEDLVQLVVENDKQRFAFNADGTKIRASQGHSVDVELGYVPATPPTVLYHGTATRHLESIQGQGLLKGTRQHVHLSAARETALKVGARHGKPVLLEVAAEQMHFDEYVFFLSDNGVWLTSHVPASYLRVSTA